MSIRLSIVVLCSLLLWGCASSGVYHTVREGQTLYRISRAYGVNEQYLARINGIADPTQLQVGERLYITGASRVRLVSSTDSAPPAPARRPSAAPAPPVKPIYLSHPALPPSRPASPPTPPSTRSAKAPKVVGLFTWPLRGKVVDGFGKRGSATGKGIEILAATGTVVKSAAAGRVIYSGDGIRSYGNLIIVKHDDSFFTVYGFNRRNLVQTGSFVSKGERIALVGSPPGGGSGRLYFEIRHGKDAVNPIFYLP